MKKAIELYNVSKSFKNHEIFKNVNLCVFEGEIVGFIGQNGTGKSVLFKLISGIYRPDSGVIKVNNQVLGSDCDFPDGIGILIDNPGFIDIYTGFQNLKYLASIKNEINDDEIKKAMEIVGLDYNNKTRVKNYSLGMKQKLAIAQAIMEKQKILILDEPFNALDDNSHKNMLELMKKFNSEGKTILITSHNANDIELLCSRKFTIKDRTIIEN